MRAPRSWQSRAALPVFVATVLLLAGCASEGRVTNPKAPGPAVGNAVGVGVGAVAGNAAGAVVGIGEGVAAGASKPFTYDPTQRVVRRWREEQTPDGRTVRIPEYYLVDEYGRVVRRLDEQGR